MPSRKYRVASAFCIAISATAILAGCGGAAKTSIPATSATVIDSASETSSSQSAASLSGGSDASITQTQRSAEPTAATIQAGDIVICRVTDEAAGLASAVQGNIAISRYVSNGDTEEGVRSVSLGKIMPGWTGGSPRCGKPNSWSPDFTQYVFTAVPPGGKASHIVLLNLASETITDLTSPRQGTSFSSAVLSDSNPGFISDAPSDRVTFGSNFIVFSENGSDRYSLDVRSPNIASPVAITNGIVAGHPESWFLSLSEDSSYGAASPDGMYITMGSKLAPATDPDAGQQVPDCPETEGEYVGAFIGWADAGNAVLVTGGIQQVELVTPSGGRLGCESLLPRTDKALSDFALSPDRSKIIFTASGPTGDEIYAVKPTIPAPDPTPSTYPRNLWASGVGGTTVFYPGNY